MDQVGDFAFFVKQVNQGERDIEGVMGQGGDRYSARLLDTFCLEGARAQLADGSHAPISENLLRNLMNGSQDAADPMGGRRVGNRAVADREVAFLHVPESIHFEWDVFHPCRRTALEWLLCQRTEDMEH